MLDRIVVLLTGFFISFQIFSQNKTLTIERTNFNSRFDDFGARFIDDRIYLVSSFCDSNSNKKTNSNNQFTDIFQVKHDSLFPAYLYSENYGKEILVSSIYNDGPIAFNKNQTILFFCNNSLSKLEAEMGIFILKKNESGAWSESIIFPHNSASYSNMNPFFDDATSTLYFSSNKPNGIGKFDIYSATFDGVSFGEMKLVKGVNSSANDSYPFIIDSTFFFSSDRLEGNGGMDIYKMNQENQIVNLGTPINSTFDDFDFTFLSKNIGFFASNRRKSNTESNNDDDVYFFHYNQTIEPIKEISKVTPKDEQQFDRLLSLSTNLLTNAKNNVYLKSANQLIASSISEFKLNNDGINNDIKQFSNLVEQILLSNNQIINDQFLPLKDRLEVEKYSLRFLQAIIKTNDPSLRAIYLDSLANLSNSSSKNIIEQAITKNNELISLLKQQKSLLDGLEKATQILFVESAKPTNNINNPIIKDQLLSYQKTYSISVNNQIINSTIELSPATIQKISDTYVSAPILFAFDSYQLSSEYDSLLLELAEFIKTNNAFQIFVDGHTDDRGKLAYNSKLSKRRAFAVKQFLIQQGVKPTDFVVAFYGPEKPVASNDTREGRKLNRRVEIRLVPREK
jgi:outer membrane protein OmpA-like peptidoglycan-associated protein